MTEMNLEIREMLRKATYESGGENLAARRNDARGVRAMVANERSKKWSVGAAMLVVIALVFLAAAPAWGQGFAQGRCGVWADGASGGKCDGDGVCSDGDGDTVFAARDAVHGCDVDTDRGEPFSDGWNRQLSLLRAGGTLRGADHRAADYWSDDVSGCDSAGRFWVIGSGKIIFRRLD